MDKLEDTHGHGCRRLSAAWPIGGGGGDGGSGGRATGARWGGELKAALKIRPPCSLARPNEAAGRTWARFVSLGR